MLTCRRLLLPAVCLCLLSQAPLLAQHVNEPLDDPGSLPLGEDGKPLNLDFERGNLEDWMVEGEAFTQQPINGPIDPQRPFGADKRSDHTGQYWLGGYERLRDEPTGRLTSKLFEIRHLYASFLIGGGSHRTTRVELVRSSDGRVLFSAQGQNQERLRPVIINTRPLMGQKVQVRVVDEHTGGWGHVNFDDFRVHDREPRFLNAAATAPPALEELYPHAGLDIAAAAEAMEVPAGFTVQPAAAEPDVKQPIAMALDDRGRVWVAEAYEYPIRAPDGEGRDRILILEDTDGNGTLDKRTVFAEQLNLVSGLEVGFGGVFVGAAPYLLFLPDADGDDRADSQGQVLLDGWGYHDTHETLNAFIWGPDGWLYGCHGVFTHSKVGKPGTPEEQRTPINAGIWRYHPLRQEFEMFAEGTSNPWGVDFDDWGQCFCTACVIPHLYHVIQGARYQRQAGNHFNPHTYDDIKTIAEHRHYTGNQWNNNDRRASDALGGGHAHAGAMVYLGGAWPQGYRNQLFMHNIHGNRVNVDHLEARGSGYVGKRSPDFLLTRDQWSQMINLRYGPDGQVWMIDWYDQNQCHRREEEVHDRSNGRVYRVVYGDAPAPAVQVDLAQQSDDALVQLQLHDNDWHVRHARRLLQERAAAGRLSDSARTALAEMAATHRDETRRLRAMWALHVTGGLPDDIVDQLLQDGSANVRGWTVQLLAEVARGDELDELAARLQRLAHNDDSPVVRRYVASALQRIPPQRRWDVLEALLQHPQDSEDHNLPLLYWYAAEPLADVSPQRALALAAGAGEAHPQLQEFMIRRLGSSRQRPLELLVEGLAAAKAAAEQRTFLRGINRSLRGARRVDAPSQWADVYQRLGQSDDSEIVLLTHQLAARMGSADGSAGLVKIATDTQQAAALRRQAVNALQAVRATDGYPALLKLLDDEAVRDDVLQALAAFDDSRTPQAVLNVFPQLSAQQRRLAVATLASRVDYARELLDAVQRGSVPRGDLTADLVRQLRNLNDAELTAKIERTWGTVRATAADRLALIREHTRLVAGDMRDVDLELGRAVFNRTCQQCHTLFGSGGKVGPDLTGANRSSLEYLLSNILDPSAVMAKEYRPSILRLESGRVITGIVREQSDEAWTVQTATDTVVVPADEIDAHKDSDQSMMPDDLLGQLDAHQRRSLIAYLQSPGQSPLLADSAHALAFFNGEDLQGWVGDERLWRVENGGIVGSSSGLDKNHFLVSELALEDFQLSLEVKLADNQGNSGIQFRSRPRSDGSVEGYQADVGPGWWGKLYEEHGRGLLTDEELPGEYLQAGDWNRYEIMAVGCRVRTWINGRLCVDLEDPQGARRGVIAFQLHSGGPTEVRFRNLQLRLLNSSEPVIGADISEAGIAQEGAQAAGAQAAAALQAAPASRVRFQRLQLDSQFRSEGVAVGDFNNDGLPDVAAGNLWYEAPDWTSHPMRDEPQAFDKKGYSDSFCNFTSDVNNDGRLDLLVVDFPGKPTWWLENPGLQGGPWKRHEATPVTNNESPAFLDVDGDGLGELLCGVEGGRMALARPGSNAYAPWNLQIFSGANAPGSDRFSHGLGAADLNRDGRTDVLVPQGWWQAPPVGAAGAWKFQPAPLGEACSQMHGFDFDADGDVDVLSSSAHQYGIWWHERIDDTFRTHLIDSSFSQTHSLHLADINSDGLPDIVTGKRHWAHNGHDPGGNEPAVLCWFELQRTADGPQWTKHTIDEDSGVGTQFVVADVDLDGLLDIAVANKKGVFLFRQRRGPQRGDH